MRRVDDSVISKYLDRLREATASGNRAVSSGGDYEKVDATNSSPDVVARVEALRVAGQLACDALSHNDETGCQNPECWKYVSATKKRR